MSEILFYQLDRQPLDRVLPSLVERTLSRGWRAVIQCGSVERLESVDLLLWTYRDDSFLPHGTKRDGHAERQPVFLTTGADNPNAAHIRFLIDGASMAELSGYERIVCLFDGADEAAVADARALWKRARAAELAVTYWQQDDQGRWIKRA